MLVSNWLSGLRGCLDLQWAFPVRRRPSRIHGAEASRIERLEPRVLLTASPVGAEFRVNTSTPDNQTLAQIAMDADGNSVVVWASYGQDGSEWGVYGQRYNASGVAQGAEFRVNTTTVGSQRDPQIAMDADGDFVVTWGSYYQDGDGTGIYAQRYNASGVAQGHEFRINSVTADNQRGQSVAMDTDGDFVVTWTSYGQDGSGAGIYAQRYTASGIAQGSEFQVNTYTSASQNSSSVAMDAEGNFVVTWTSNGQDGSFYGVYAQRYNSAGVAQGGEFLVNSTTAGIQRGSRIAMAADGDFVIAWNSFGQDGGGIGVYGQRYNAAGTAQGVEFQVNTTTSENQFGPSIAMDASGDYVVTWTSYGQDGGGYGIYGQQYNAAGVAQGSEFLVNSSTSGNQLNPSVAINAHGDFAVVWTSMNQDGSSGGVYAQRYDVATDDAGPIVSGVLDGQRPITSEGRLVSAVSELTVLFSEDLNVAGGSSGINSVTNPANWRLTRNGVDVSATITGITFGFNAATNKYEAVLSLSTALADGQFQLTARDTIQDLASNPLDGDDDGTPGGDFLLSFITATAKPAGSEFQVNTTTTGEQKTNELGQGGSVAMDAQGNSVIVWTSVGQDGSGIGVYAQRFNAAGGAAGTEFQVNTVAADNQRDPRVAMSASGDFVISWTSANQDGSGYGIFAQRYNAAGVAQGAEFQVNTTTFGSQVHSSIAMDADGDFVIAWKSDSQDGSGSGVYAQRYTSLGVAQGAEFLVNTTTINNQGSPAVAMDADGDFVIAWNSYGQDGDRNGVFAQRYSAAGIALGSEFQVNTTTADEQMLPSVAIDLAGNFVVTWTSHGQDGSSWGVFGQRYNSAGTAQGSEFQINTVTDIYQTFSSVAMDADGDFVVTWTSIGQDGSSDGIFAQRFNANGVAEGTEFQVNTTTLYTQYYSSVAMSSDGDFIIAWTSYLQDGEGDGVFAQRYQSNIAPNLTIPAGMIYVENDPATAIAAGITISDPDSATLTSATVTLTNFVAGQDVLAFANDGSTMGNISLSSNDGGVLTLISVGGTATLSQWQSALRAVTYANTSDNPDTTQRSVEFVVNDGTDPSNTLTSTIDITAANDAPVLGGADSITYIENDPATVIASGITVADLDSATLTSATVTLTNFVAGQDVLAFANDGSTMGNISLSSNDGGVLTLISVGGTATLSQWQSALRAVTYANTSDNPDTTQRSVEFVVNDGTDPSNTLTSTIDITAANDAPVLGGADSITYIENDPATVIASGITVADLDSATLTSATVTLTNFVAGEDVLAFANDGSTMGNISLSSNDGGVLTLISVGGTATLSQWQSALRAVTYANTSDNPDTTQRTVEFVVNDGTDPSNTLTSTIDITAANDAPVLADLETSALNYVPNSPATVITSTLNISDLDDANLTGAVIQISGGYQAGDVLGFENTPNIVGFFDAETGTLTLTGSDSVANYQAALRSVTFVSSSTNAAPRTVSFQVSDGTDSSNSVSRTVGGYAQLNGGTVNIYGTSLVDVITVTDSGPLQFVVNGVVTEFDSSQVTTINIFAYGGNDTVQINSLTGAKSMTVYGGGGNDTLRVAAGVTRGILLNGGDGNDLLIGGSGNDVLIGGAGNDWLNGGDGSDTIDGGAGNDVYAFGAAIGNQTDTIVELSGGGTDLLNFSSMTTAVTVNLVSDTALATMAHRIVMVSSAGQSAYLENVSGGSANDFITGNAANNELSGNGGNDTLNGGDGSDYLDGGEGNDLLKGGNHDDILIGGAGNDYLMGEAGFDRLNGGDGANSLEGGLGDDVYIFSPATVNQIDTVAELADGGTDTLDFSALTTAVTVNLTSDTVLASMAQRIVKVSQAGQSANFENAIGGSGNDQITGNASNNLLVGNGGNDTISGGSGNDILLGGQGNDTLKGISGRNLLIGGVGSDLLLGGTDGDLLLSGATTFESDPTILQALMAEWASGNTYQSRVDHLLGTTSGGANTSFTLNASTVSNDASADYLTGNADQDWFLAGTSQDVLTDKAVNEIFTQIDSWI